MVDAGKDERLARLRSQIARIEGGDAGRRISITPPCPAAGDDGRDGIAAGTAFRDSGPAPGVSDAGTSGTGRPALPFGIAEIDRRLPGHGLQSGRLHEVVGAIEGAGTSLVVHLLRRLMAQESRQGLNGGGPVFWCAPQASLYAPGLACRGLAVDRLIMVTAPRREDRLWAMEECLRCSGVLAVVGELQARERIDLTASRRLQLAAGQGGAMALLLRPPVWRQHKPERQDGPADGGDLDDEGALGASAAVTRWQVRSLPATRAGADDGDSPGNDDMGRHSCWRLVLSRSRAGARHGWMVEVDHATGDFALASPLRDRSGAAADTQAVA